MKKKRLLCGALAALTVTAGMVMPASAANSASATLNKGAKSVWSGKIVDNQIALTEAWNSADSARNVYYDFKYYNGSSYKKDKNAADLDPNDSLHSTVYSNKKAADMTWILQINTWNCWYNGCYAYGKIAKA